MYFPFTDLPPRKLRFFLTCHDHLFFCVFQGMLQLARLYLTVDDLDACQQQCVQLLKMDAENDDATVVSKTTFARRAKSKMFFFRQGAIFCSIPFMVVFVVFF